jgi:hypothetical protein
MAKQEFHFGDRVKIVRGAHGGKTRQVAQTTPDDALVGVRFDSTELQFFAASDVVKLKASTGGASAKN